MFVFPVAPKDLFSERSVQMRGWGIPFPIIDRVRAKVTDTWLDAPGGWSFEWSAEALLAASQGKHLLAALCYGAARFPCAATPDRRQAQENQIASYLRASRKFPCSFERRILTVDFRGTPTTVPIHLFARRNNQRDRPIICFSGGVDTCKVELHKIALALAIGGDFLVASIDMPGTGESKISLTPDAEQIYIQVLDHLRAEMKTMVKTAAIGVSFGAHWSTKLGMMKAVNAAVDIGGPVGYLPLDSEFLKHLPNGMPGIIANSMGLDEMPMGEDANALLKAFSLREQELFKVKEIAPLFVINGTEDPYIPAEETTVFKKFPNATVWQVKGTSHCGAEKFARFLPKIIVWLREHLHGTSLSTRALAFVADSIFPPSI